MSVKKGRGWANPPSQPGKSTLSCPDFRLATFRTMRWMLLSPKLCYVVTASQNTKCHNLGAEAQARLHFPLRVPWFPVHSLANGEGVCVQYLRSIMLSRRNMAHLLGSASPGWELSFCLCQETNSLHQQVLITTSSSLYMPKLLPILPKIFSYSFCLFVFKAIKHTGFIYLKISPYTEL